MTQRDFYTAIENANVSDELKAFATEALAKLDARNAKSASTSASKREAENAPLIKSISELLTTEPMLASDIAKALEISVSKATAYVKKVDGVNVTDVKVKGKGTQKGYYLAE